MAHLFEGKKTDDGAKGTTASHDKNGIVGENTDSTSRNALALSGNGVLGTTKVPDGFGVFGAHAGLGAGVGGVGIIGLWGGSAIGVGVMGISTPYGSKGGDGVLGMTNNELRNGIHGRNVSPTKRGTTDSIGTDSVGNGVFGFSRVPDGAGVMGVNGSGFGTGVKGNGDFGVKGTGFKIGIWGIGQGEGWAGQFSGPVLVTGPSHFEQGVISNNNGGEGVHAETQSRRSAALVAIQKYPDPDSSCALFVKHEGGGTAAVFEGGTAAFFNGNAEVTGDIVLTNAADCAEDFDVIDMGASEPGTVMVLGRGGILEACSRSHDRRVVGVVSGAADFKAGLVLDRQYDRSARRPIALMGKVYCKADARYGKIEIGDLLTTSSTIGHAMRADDHLAALGAIVGKAMQALDDGCGLIPIVVLR